MGQEKQTRRPTLLRLGTQHVSNAGIRGKVNNNPVERLQGMKRVRDKVLRALKKDDTPIREGFNIYYNFIRPHQGLEGKTPAEVAGINLDLDRNKRLGLIKKSLSNVRQNGML